MTEDIISNMEWLETTQGDIIPCISIENLIDILENHAVITKEQGWKLYHAQ